MNNLKLEHYNSTVHMSKSRINIQERKHWYVANIPLGLNFKAIYLNGILQYVSVDSEYPTSIGSKIERLLPTIIETIINIENVEVYGIIHLKNECNKDYFIDELHEVVFLLRELEDELQEKLNITILKAKGKHKELDISSIYEISTQNQLTADYKLLPTEELERPIKNDIYVVSDDLELEEYYYNRNMVHIGTVINIEQKHDGENIGLSVEIREKITGEIFEYYTKDVYTDIETDENILFSLSENKVVIKKE